VKLAEILRARVDGFQDRWKPPECPNITGRDSRTSR
jgi:hypothetical protein